MEYVSIGNDIVTLLCELFDLNFGVNGNIYFMRQPKSEETEIFWLIQNGGYVDRQLKTKQKILTYNFTLNYRAVKAKDVDKTLTMIENTINHITCPKLAHYDCYALQASALGTNQDVDNINAYQGSIQIQVKVHDDYSS